MSPKIRIHPYLSKALSRVYLGGMDQNKLIEMATSSEVWATPEKEKATRMEFKSNEKGWQEWGPEVASWEKVLAGLKQLNDSNGKPRKLDFKFYKKLPGIGDNIWFNSEIGKDAPVNIDEGAVLLVKPVDGEKIKIEGVYFGPTANSWKFSNKNKDAKVEVKKSFGLAQNIGLPNYKQIYVYIAERPKKLQLEIRLILSQEQLGKLRNAIEQTQKKLNDLKKNQNNLVRTSVGFIYYKSRQPVIKFNVE